jgi:predicted nucleic acid-binding protein
MPTRDEPPDVLVDTSAAVALVVADHDHHDVTAARLAGRRLGMAGHAAFETFSLLTRLPSAARRPPSVIAELLAANFPANRYLSAKGASALMKRLSVLRIAGGSVYDALVGATAAEHRVVLASRDRRAVETYRALGVEIEVLSDQ